MAKRKKHNSWKWIVVLLVILFSLFVIYFIAAWFGYDFLGLFSVIPVNPPNEYQGYWVRLTVTPNERCIGETMIFGITSNLPNGTCATFAYNNGTWIDLDRGFELSAMGGYSTTDAIYALGEATIKVVCKDDIDRFRSSNTIDIIITDCDSDGDGWSNAEEIEAGTDPFEDCDFPGSPEGSDGEEDFSQCNIECTNDGYDYGTGTVPSPGLCGSASAIITIGVDEHCCCYFTDSSQCWNFCISVGYDYGVFEVADRDCQGYETQLDDGDDSCCCGTYLPDMYECGWSCFMAEGEGYWGFYDPIGESCGYPDIWNAPCCCFLE